VTGSSKVNARPLGSGLDFDWGVVRHDLGDDFANLRSMAPVLDPTTTQSRRRTGLGPKTMRAIPAPPQPPASRRKTQRWRWRRAESAPRWCACRRRSMAMATTASFRLSSASRVKRASRRMWVTGSTAGPRCTGSMLPTSSGLALEKGSAGARYHGVADEGVPVRDIADVIGRRLDVPVVPKSPEEAAGHFGFLGHFLGIDCPASSAQTQERLGWRPTQPGLIPDLDHARYFGA
jgi:hypothetical protein